MEKKTGKNIQTIFVMAASLLCALVGAAFLFIPQIGPTAICYTCCVGMIVWGIAQIGKYFVAESYRRLHDYSFAIGAAFVILGCCGLVRAREIVSYQEAFLGAAILAIGIVLLQCTVQLKLVNSILWIAELIIALIVIICAVLILADVPILLGHIRIFSYWVLFFSGIINLISFPTVAIMIYKDRNRASVDEGCYEYEDEIMEPEYIEDQEAYEMDETEDENVEDEIV